MTDLLLYQCLNYGKITWWFWAWGGTPHPIQFLLPYWTKYLRGVSAGSSFWSCQCNWLYRILIIWCWKAKLWRNVFTVSNILFRIALGQGAFVQRVDLPQAWHFMGSGLIKAQPKRKPTYILHSWFNWISYQNDWGFTQEGDVTSAKVVSGHQNTVPSGALQRTWTPATSFLFLQMLSSLSHFEGRKKPPSDSKTWATNQPLTALTASGVLTRQSDYVKSNFGGHFSGQMNLDA